MSAKNLTRRDVLKRTLGTAGLAGMAPYVWTTEQVRAQSPNDGFGVLTVGVRGRGGAVGRMAAGYGRCVAVCDVDTASADGFIAKLGSQQKAVPDVCKDYRKALERKDVDLVTIGTPDHWHTAILIAALRAGKDVYCEKPMTLTIDEGKLICKVAKETGRVIQVGTQQRTEMDQRFLQAIAIAKSGRIGKTLTVTCSIGGAPNKGPFDISAPPATLDWDFWQGQTRDTPFCKERCHGNFRWWLEYSGGKMTDWGAHHVDIAQWAIGADHTGPVEIEGTGVLPAGREDTLAMITGRKLSSDLPNRFNAATTFQVQLRFSNGNTIIVRHGPDNGLLFEGEKGRFFVNRSKLVGVPVEEIAADEAQTQWLNDAVVKLYNGRTPTSHMGNFIDCVKDRSQPISDVFTHHRAVSSCHLCNIALLLGRKLHWDPVREDFINDPEASTMLAREQRKPYVTET
ncbi:MAG: Gfo/Idh/MocA family oxidoreductase [Planctomycetaceae bacterium]|nr:Gfo/Idh/MocA family oxidoreductase [Planctomycetaceae bacterium]